MATEAQIKARVESSGRNWDQKCQAFVYNVCAWFGGAVRPYPSAINAYENSGIISKNATTAPPGAIHYWAIGAYGHVGISLGAGRVLMGSKYVDVKWGLNAGVTTVARYTARTGARYLGWARSNGKNHITITAPVSGVDKEHVKAVAKFLNNQKLGKKTTADKDGVRGAVYWWLVQTWGRKNGVYPSQYKIDGEPGSRSRLVEQELIKKTS